MNSNESPRTSPRRPLLASFAGLIAVSAYGGAAALATGAAHAPGAAIVAGTLLVGWIIVELAFIRTLRWLQPAMAAAGVLVSGLRPRLRRSAG
jgi:hypothetical protein